ncbi:MAG: sec-independent protein translocase protein TatC [Alphaproteobacteria bacterium]|jgi:sec-independent protein translocase protein TatC
MSDNIDHKSSDNEPYNDTSMSLIGHLTELRSRLIKAVIFLLIAVSVCFYFSEDIFITLLYPLKKAMGDDITVSYFAPHEAFFVYMNLSLYAGLIITVPVILHQIWAFIAPGLYYSEQKMARPFLLFAPIMFIIGGLFAYLLVLPNALEFFASFQTSVTSEVNHNINIIQQIRVQDYAHFALSFILVFGLAFELPIILILLGLFGILTAYQLRYYRKYAVMIIMVMSAMVTPPDLLSMIALCLPLQLLYEVSILVIQFYERTKNVKKD